jgi:hypothetical protein
MLQEKITQSEFPLSKTNILHFELIILFNNTLLTQGLYSEDRHIKVLEGGNHSQVSLIQRQKAGGS